MRSCVYSTCTSAACCAMWRARWRCSWVRSCLWGLPSCVHVALVVTLRMGHLFMPSISLRWSVRLRSMLQTCLAWKELEIASMRGGQSSVDQQRARRYWLLALVYDGTKSDARF